MNGSQENHLSGKLAVPTRAGSLSDRVQSLRLPQEPSSSGVGKGVAWLLTLLLTGLGGGLGYAVYALNTAVAAQAAEVADLKQKLTAGDFGALAGRTATLAETPIPAVGEVASSGDVVLESKGYIMAAHLILVSPKVGGMVTKLNIEEGMRVNKGDVLAELETVEYAADRDRAKATLEMARQRLLELERGNRPEEIEQAKHELEEAEAQKEQLYLDWKRTQNLRTGGALAARDHEQSLSQYRMMERRVERLKQALKLMIEGPRAERIAAARAEVAQAEADLAKAQWRLDNTKVTAPVTGTILSKKAEEGNMVNPSAFSNGLSASLCEMADLSDLEVELSIQERDISKVFKGQKCKVRAEAFPTRVYDGVVSRLMPIADRAKGAIPVRVKLSVPREEEGVYLKPDMGAIVSFLKK